ncbi:GNAT family N-acetyltransferase [Orenia marismortui]|uniref:GNAT family N-acetyltransferase n=1 Tax=Orenia marismortui TaxID=46469 RepID=UPI00035D7303|nr:GNAT family N-acetyltransferase [Orenia marismortui]
MEIRKIPANKTWSLRHEVMWPHKDIEYVKLENDNDGIHYGLFIKNKLISVISLFIKDNQAQFRKFATRTAKQGRGYGSKLLNYIIEESKSLGLEKIWCNAREDKVDFYKKFGLIESTNSFNRGKIKYIIMEKTLVIE